MRLLCRLFGCRSDEVTYLDFGMIEHWCSRCGTVIIHDIEGQIEDLDLTLEDIERLFPHVDWES